jgi:ABC-2 type transport system ATP-binding protein
VSARVPAEAQVEAAGAAIRARGLRRSFGRFVAVDGVDVEVASGEVFGLLGANGAGKTTTIRMLCGMLAPDAGSVAVGGVDMVRHARRARGRIGYVAQRWALYGDLSVEENLELQAGLYGLHGARSRERRRWALEYLALDAVAQSPAGELPLGFQRRLALGAALLHEPTVLFLDEPTSGMDPLARQQLWDLIYELAEGGIGILVTTHYMDEAMFCDRLALMHAGRIVAGGEPEALLATPLDTPILELRAQDCAACRRCVQQEPFVREVVPGAGHLRIRLQPGCEPRQAAEALGRRLAGLGAAVDSLAPARPALEDVFVALLERSAD